MRYLSKKKVTVSFPNFESKTLVTIVVNFLQKNLHVKVKTQIIL